MINIKLVSPTINIKWRGWKPRILSAATVYNGGRIRWWILTWLGFTLDITQRTPFEMLRWEDVSKL